MIRQSSESGSGIPGWSESDGCTSSRGSNSEAAGAAHRAARFATGEATGGPALVDVLTALQLSGGLETRIERSKEGGETSFMVFGPSPDPQIEAKREEIRGILGLTPGNREIRIFYGATPGRATRSP
jgi:hypothetical protein